MAGEGDVIKEFAVRCQGDTVGIDSVFPGYAVDDEGVGFGFGGGAVLQEAARFFVFEVECDDGAATGVGDEGEVALGVDADVIEVGVLIVGFGWEVVCVSEGIALEVELVEDWAGGLDALEFGVVGVEDPEAVKAVDENGLDGVEGLVVATVLPVFVGEGDGLAVDDLGDGDGDVVGPVGEVGEDAVLSANGDTGPLVGRGGDGGERVLWGSGFGLNGLGWGAEWE